MALSSSNQLTKIANSIPLQQAQLNWYEWAKHGSQCPGLNWPHWTPLMTTNRKDTMVTSPCLLVLWPWCLLDLINSTRPLRNHTKPHGCHRCPYYRHHSNILKQGSENTSRIQNWVSHARHTDYTTIMLTNNRLHAGLASKASVIKFSYG